jgi:hypothetical protein
MSPAERARRALSDAGFSVFRPGEAMGPCKEAYLVVFDGGLTPRAGRASSARWASPPTRRWAASRSCSRC